MKGLQRLVNKFQRRELKIDFCLTVQCGQKNRAESLSKSFTVMGRKFKFSAQDCDLEYLCWRCKIFPVSSDLKPPLVLRLWQYGLWSFQAGGTKLERFLPKNQHTQRKLLNFENWVNGEVSKSVQKCQNLTFKVNFLCQKLSESFSIFY